MLYMKIYFIHIKVSSLYMEGILLLFPMENNVLLSVTFIKAVSPQHISIAEDAEHIRHIPRSAFDL